jgi:outer membrane protein assembly factor BamB
LRRGIEEKENEAMKTYKMREHTGFFGQVMKRAIAPALLAWALVGGQAALGDDWPQFRGPNRDGKSAETGLLKEWPEGGPKLLWWTNGLGKGYSSIAVVKDTVYTAGMERRLAVTTDKTGQVRTNSVGEAVIFALGLDGKLKWKADAGVEWSGGYDGCRSTPTVHNGRIFFLTGHAILSCLDAKDGAKLWSVDTRTNYNAIGSTHGFGESLLIVGNLVVCTASGTTNGSTMVAFAQDTGQVVWTTPGMGYGTATCSPILVERRGTKVIVGAVAHKLIGVNAADGALLWQFPWLDRTDNPTKEDPKTDGFICGPALYLDGRIFMTNRRKEGGVMLDLAADGKSVKEAWTQERMNTVLGGFVLVDGYVYGSSWFVYQSLQSKDPSIPDEKKDLNRARRKLPWVCLDWANGTVMCEAEGVGSQGQIIYADGMLYCYGERGTVGLVAATPKEHKVISRFRITQGTGPHFNQPAISGGRLYIRHDDVLMCYNIKK